MDTNKLHKINNCQREYQEICQKEEKLQKELEDLAIKKKHVKKELDGLMKDERIAMDILGRVYEQRKVQDPKKPRK